MTRRVQIFTRALRREDADALDRMWRKRSFEWFSITDRARQRRFPTAFTPRAARRLLHRAGGFPIRIDDVAVNSRERYEGRLGANFSYTGTWRENGPQELRGKGMMLCSASPIVVWSMAFGDQ